MVRFYRFCGFLLFLAVCLFAFEARAGDPKLEFRTIETEHFKIHYHQGLEGVARRAATIMEEVHTDLSILFEWEIVKPTNVVITDFTDSANGSSSAMYQPLIRLYATAPTNTSSLQYNDDYLRTLFIHEYTHMISLRIHSGFARVVNAIFGDVHFPNTLTPRWYHEGISVLMETYQTTRGRIRAPYFEMVCRAAIIEGTFPTLGEVSNDSRVYPRGTGHYVYGAMFMDYLRDRYGTEKIVEVYHVLGGDLVPYGMNRAFEEVFGLDLVTIYGHWRASVEADALAVKKRIEDSGVTESTRITYGGETKGAPIFTLDDQAVLIALWNGWEKSSVYKVGIDGTSKEQVVLSGATSDLSMDRSGRLFYTRTAPFELHYRFNDVFVLDGFGQDPRRVTHGARSWDAAVSPSGDRLVMTRTEAGASKLVLADELGNVKRTLVEPNLYNQVYKPAWSPDETQIAVVLRQRERVDIALIDVETGATRFVTDDYAIEAEPFFHPDGEHLLYKSSLNGIDNIYATNLASGEVLQVTNVLTGASAPAVSSDGKTLVFLQYSGRGWDLHTMPLSLSTLGPATETEYERPIPRPSPPPSEAPSGPYNPLPTFLPKYWNLGVMFDTSGGLIVQGLTTFYDATERHQASAIVGYGVTDSIFQGAFTYAYSGLGPGLTLSLSRTGSPRQTGYTVNGDEQQWIQEITRATTNLSFPVPGLDRGHNLQVGYNLTHAKPREEPVVTYDPTQSPQDVPNQYFRAGLTFGWSFSDTVISPYGISPHKGRNLSSGISLYHPYLGGNQTLASFDYAWEEYIKMPWFDYHVFAMRLSGRVYLSDPPGQSSMFIGGYSPQNYVDVILNATESGLPGIRGYPEGAFEGDKYHSLRLEYRFPIWFTEAAYNTLPVYLRRIQAGVFTDNAVISLDPLDTDDWRSSVGAEIVWHIAIRYFQPMTLRTGYAYGLMEYGLHEIIVTFGQGF